MNTVTVRITAPNETCKSNCAHYILSILFATLALMNILTQCSYRFIIENVLQPFSKRKSSKSYKKIRNSERLIKLLEISLFIHTSLIDAIYRVTIKLVKVIYSVAAELIIKVSYSKSFPLVMLLCFPYQLGN